MYKFEPLLKQTIWGGDRIIAFKHLSTEMENVGESWEVSGVKGNESVVAYGPDKGKSLNQLVREQKERLVGRENYRRFGDEFPLLVKFIDARSDLSIQVHPDDETARRQGKGRGKTEMWYCLGGDTPEGQQGHLLLGLKERITPDEYERMVRESTITSALAYYEEREGDVFFIPAGRIHAIGAGSFVAEIQETSDITYRIYDYNRRDSEGHLRQLHVKEAAECIDFSVCDDYRTHYTPAVNQGVEVVRCSQFTTTVYDLTEPLTLDYTEHDAFVILIAVKGEGQISSGGETTSLRAGETVLLPASTGEVRIEGTVKFIETTV